MIVLGLVGSPAGGKSTVAATLAGCGATWIDADKIAREVLDRPHIRDTLAVRFGTEILADHGRVDRQRLAAIVFGDDDSKGLALNYLESIVHPPTRVEIGARLKDAAARKVAVAVLDVPLLFEAGWDLACDQVWCVDAPFGVRVNRATGRGWDASEMRRRESRQLPIAEKKRRSGRAIPNHRTPQDLAELVETLYASLEKSSRESPPDPGHCLTD